MDIGIWYYHVMQVFWAVATIWTGSIAWSYGRRRGLGKLAHGLVGRVRGFRWLNTRPAYVDTNYALVLPLLFGVYSIYFTLSHHYWTGDNNWVVRFPIWFAQVIPLYRIAESGAGWRRTLADFVTGDSRWVAVAWGFCYLSGRYPIGSYAQAGARLGILIACAIIVLREVRRRGGWLETAKGPDAPEFKSADSPDAEDTPRKTSPVTAVTCVIATLGLLAVPAQLKAQGGPWDTPAGADSMILARSKAHRDTGLAQIARATSDTLRAVGLGNLAKSNFELGDFAVGEKYARELLALTATLPPTYWNYGNAVHDANLVLGRAAVRAGRLDEAKRYLHASTRGVGEAPNPGSPQMKGVGPNMSLVYDLLLKGDRGDRQAVLDYFDWVDTVWPRGTEKLKQWRADVRAGRIPNFGPNRIY